MNNPGRTSSRIFNGRDLGEVASPAGGLSTNANAVNLKPTEYRDSRRTSYVIMIKQSPSLPLSFSAVRTTVFSLLSNCKGVGWTLRESNDKTKRLALSLTRSSRYDSRPRIFRGGRNHTTGRWEYSHGRSGDNRFIYRPRVYRPCRK
jgi:hypothetical protein